MGIITRLEVCKRRKDKVNVHIDEQFNTTLSTLTVMNHRLKLGMELSEDKLKEIKATSEVEQAFNKCLDLLSRCSKSAKQVRDYMVDRKFDPYVIDLVIEKLKGYNYLDDNNFASQYVEFASVNKGARRISYELKAKGVNEEIINNALSKVDKDTSIQGALNAITKYFRSKEVDKANLVKVHRLLLSRGYDYETITSALRQFNDNIEIETE